MQPRCVAANITDLPDLCLLWRREPVAVDVQRATEAALCAPVGMARLLVRNLHGSIDFLPQADVEITQLTLIDIAWRISEQTLCSLSLGEGDNIADRIDTGH